MSGPPVVTVIGRDTLLVAVGDARHVVYVVGPPSDRWAFWNGLVFHSRGDQEAAARRTTRAPGQTAHTLTAPMPASVIKVLVVAGAKVPRGAPVVILEAMKMELPVRALEEGTVTAVYCREGDLVQADQPLVDLE